MSKFKDQEGFFDCAGRHVRGRTRKNKYRPAPLRMTWCGGKGLAPTRSGGTSLLFVILSAALRFAPRMILRGEGSLLVTDNHPPQFTASSSRVHCAFSRSLPICAPCRVTLLRMTVCLGGLRRRPTQRCRMPRSPAISKWQIAQFRAAGNGLTGEASREQIALAVLRHFNHREITAWDATDEQVYFRIGDPGARNQIPGAPPQRHGIPGVHVHLPYRTFANAGGRQLTRAGSRRDQVVALVGHRNGFGSANDYVGELLKALEQGRYQASFVDD
jgi:hypothetical protein